MLIAKSIVATRMRVIEKEDVFPALLQHFETYLRRARVQCLVVSGIPLQPSSLDYPIAEGFTMKAEQGYVG